MIHYAYYTNTGRYVQSGTAVSEVSEYDIPAGCFVYYGEVDIGSQYHNLSTDAPTDKGDPPAEGYEFNYLTKQWVVDSVYLDTKARSTRQQLLLASDWTDTASAPARLGQELYAQWQVYRQALRDITTQSTYPVNVVWPTPPQ